MFKKAFAVFAIALFVFCQGCGGSSPTANSSAGPVAPADNGLFDENNQPQPDVSTPPPIPSISINEARVDAFIAGLYSNLFNRNADQDGFLFYKQQMMAAQTEAELINLCLDTVENFFYSNEYGLSSELFPNIIQDVYIAFYGRQVDMPGYDYWLGQLGTGLVTDAQFVQIIKSQDEARQTCEDKLFGSAGGSDDVVCAQVIVCGTNGISYPSPCSAAEAGTEVAHNGYCRI